jgi:hypothetical protein
VENSHDFLNSAKDIFGNEFEALSVDLNLLREVGSSGVNMADLFGDGRLSIIVAAGGAYPGDLLTTSVYCPKSLPGNYLNVRLVGVESNRSAIGARVTVSMLADTSGRFNVMWVENRHDRSIVAGSRRAITLY